MAEKSQTILTPDPPGTRPLGNRNDGNIKASFPDSPLPGYAAAQYSDQERTNTYQEEVLTGKRPDGHGISNFNLDFEGTNEDPVPNIEENNPGTATAITTDGKAFGEGAGAPTTQYIPPLVSPGPGSTSATDQNAYNGTTKDPANTSVFGSGIGGLASPHGTSEEIAKQSLLSNYISGKSYGGSS